MPPRHRVPLAVLAIALHALLGTPAAAQPVIESGGRVTVEAFLSKYWLDQRDADGRRTDVDGLGGRGMSHMGLLPGTDGHSAVVDLVAGDGGTQRGAGRGGEHLV